MIMFKNFTTFRINHQRRNATRRGLIRQYNTFMYLPTATFKTSLNNYEPTVSLSSFTTRLYF